MNKKILGLLLVLLISSCSISIINPLSTSFSTSNTTSTLTTSNSTSFSSSSEPSNSEIVPSTTVNETTTLNPTSCPTEVSPSTSETVPSTSEVTPQTSLIEPSTSKPEPSSSSFPSSSEPDEVQKERIIPYVNLLNTEWESYGSKRNTISFEQYDDNNYELSIYNSNPTETYTTQFLNNDNSVIAKATYRIEFSIKSSISRVIKLVFQEGTYSYCDLDENITLNANQEETISFEFTALKTKSNMLLGFLTGKIGDNYNGHQTIDVINPGLYLIKEPVEDNGLVHDLNETPSKEGYNLLWADEFNGFSLDKNNWAYEEGTAGNGWGNNELQYYTSRIENSYVTNGSLKISALKELVVECDYTSARIRTKDLFEFTYGYVEARIALPSTKGIWPAFWMLGANMDEVNWPSCGEIDILEAINDETNTVYSALHWYDDISQGHATLGTDSTTISNRCEYHIYAMEWTKTYIKMFVDGKQTFFFDTTPSRYLNVFNNSYYFTLNVAVGGNWPGFEISDDFPQVMNVDYIRVYQEK